MSTEQKEKIKISLAGVIADLDNGLDRKAIRTKYGLSATDAKRLFDDPVLKGRRIRTAPAFELIRDVEAAAPVATATAVATAKPSDQPTPAASKPKAVAKPKPEAPAAVEQPKAETEEEKETQQETPAANSTGISEVATDDDNEPDEEAEDLDEDAKK